MNNHLKTYFASGKTREISFRIDQLKKLKRAIINNEAEIFDALWKDLHKSEEESYLTEISIVIGEIDYHIKHLKRWSKEHSTKSNFQVFPSRSYIKSEPLGTALIIAPWNYPFQLLMNPLVGAISTGCCAMLKPSPASKHTSDVLEKIVKSTFNSDYIDIVLGDREVNTALLKERWDMIFFTGSSMLGRIVYQAAAQYLTPVVLELGGKSPCIVDEDCDTQLTAKRIAFGKLLNSGQTCIAPDYIFVHKKKKEALINAIKQEIEAMYGSDVSSSNYYPRIISDKAFERLIGLIESDKVVYGGETIKEQRYIAPTILDNITEESPVMQEEIFGPLFPVMTYEAIEEVVEYVNKHEKPLALYYFGKKNEQFILNNTSSGGACINDTIMHVSNHHLPFGGVGNSGMGSYHGKRSFDAFSHQKAILKSPTWIDVPLKYAPFKFYNLIRKFL